MEWVIEDHSVLFRAFEIPKCRKVKNGLNTSQWNDEIYIRKRHFASFLPESKPQDVEFLNSPNYVRIR